MGEDFGVWINAAEERGRQIRPMPGPVTSGGGSGWLTDRAPSTGTTISESSAFGVSAFFSCVAMVSEDAAGCEIDIRQKNDSGKYLINANSHPVYTLLNEVINWYSIPMAVWSAMHAASIVHGNSYAEIERDPRTGNPIGIWPLVRWSVQPWIAKTDDRLYYNVTGYGGAHDIPAENILHFRGFGTDGFMGLSMLRVMRERLGLSIAMERAAGRMIANGSRPGGILTTPHTLTDEAADRLRRLWYGRHQGTEQTGHVAILEGGYTWHEAQLGNDEMQFLESLNWSVEEFARFWRIPLSKLGVKGANAFSNQEQDANAYVISAILPLHKRAAQEINVKLLPFGHRCRYDREELLAVDTPTRDKSWFTGRQGGWYSINDILEKQGREPIPGGDRHETALNMIPVLADGPHLPGQPPAPGSPAAAPAQGTDSQPAADTQAAAPAGDAGEGPADDFDLVGKGTIFVDLMSRVSKGDISKAAAILFAKSAYKTMNPSEIEAIFAAISEGASKQDPAKPEPAQPAA